ncbi:hypothetical protein DSO57_1029951 [Entomophthora muscae]|uniref:Uncharacterized protein n=1 Tax=Entomophthora muscae TaxID=34485 RepID=A0ACC2SQ91_9FUNG|nr:hypothetical protein DSO57_1029951 [Entomophthora muscae]
MNLWFSQVILYLILVLFHLQSTSHGSAPHTLQPQETVDQLPKFYCPPGAPYGPVHFTKYLPNPVYFEFTLEGILIYKPEARTREIKTIYREGNKITRPPLLFCDKYNYLPTYLVPMTPPLTPWPNCPQESVAANESTSTQIFGVIVRIDNFSPLELQAQEQELNLDSPGPLGQRTARPTTRIFLGLSPCKLRLKKTTCPEK